MTNEQQYSGKAKDIVYTKDEKVKIVFRNSISAFDGDKTDELKGKGTVNCRISTILFKILETYGIDTHFIKSETENSMICKKVEIIPVESVCRNIMAGSFCRRYGVEEGIEFSEPLVEFFYKEDKLHDPLVTKEAAIKLKWMSRKESILMETITRAVNLILSKIFKQINLKLVDFKLEFGKTKSGKVIVADEISADTMRLWEKETGEIKDKDRYRKDLGNVIKHYTDVAERLEHITQLPEIKFTTSGFVSIELKESVLDPAGEITQRSLERLGHESLDSVRLGKKAVLHFNVPPSANLYDNIHVMSEKILANPLIENYTIDISFSDKQNRLD